MFYEILLVEYVKELCVETLKQNLYVYIVILLIHYYIIFILR